MINNPHIGNLFSAEDEDCLSQSQMRDFAEDKLTGTAKNQVERHLLNCDLCAMSIDGVVALTIEEVDTGVASITEEAWQQVGSVEKKRRSAAAFWMSSAAAVLLLIVVGFIVIDRNQEKEHLGDLAENMFQPPPVNTPNPKVHRDAQPTEDDGLFEEELEKSKEPIGKEDGKKDLENKDGLSSIVSDGPSMEFNAYKPAPKAEQEEIALVLEDSEDNELNYDGSPILASSMSSDKVMDSKNTFDTNLPTLTTTSAINGNVSNSGYVTSGTVTAMDSIISWNQIRTEPSVNEPLSDLTGGIDNEDFDDAFAVVEDSESEEKKGVDAFSGGDFGGVELDELKPARDMDQSMADAEERSSEQVVNRRKSSVKEKGRAPNLFKGKKKSQSAKSSPKPLSSFEQGIVFYQAKSYQKGANLLRQATQQSPNNLEAHFYAAMCYLQLQQPDAAIFHLDRVIPETGTSHAKDAVWFKSLALLQKGNKSEAKVLLQEVEAENATYRKKARKTLDEL